MHPPKAQGRLKGRKPLAVIDIGSNSVRLVVYEGLVRAPTVLFNEKILCGLGKGVATTGRLEESSVTMALRTLKRFRALCDQMGTIAIHTLATAAAREAENGPAFITEAEEILGVEINVLSGKQEAEYSAAGIFSSFYKPNGIAGDLGGGSLELVDIHGNKATNGVTLPLGGLRLQDMAHGNLSEATKISRHYLRKTAMLQAGKGRKFYAVGGTWRNLAKLHMSAKNYPLPVMHAYEVVTDDVESFLQRVAHGELDHMRGISAVSKNRRQLLSYGATVLIELIYCMEPEAIVFSGAGVREGFLYSLLPKKLQKADPLLAATEEMSVLRSRSPQHARELIDWTTKAFEVLGIEETENERRTREAACFLSDIGWRIHPDYRGDLASNQIALGAYPGIDHAGRVYAALAVYFRNEGLVHDSDAPSIMKLADDATAYKARVLGALMRVANIFSGSTAGLLPQILWQKQKQGVSIIIPTKCADLIAERPIGRLQQLEKLVSIPLQYQTS